MKIKKSLVVLSMVIGFLFVLGGCAKKEAPVKTVSYPQKTIKLISFNNPGAGADLMNRKLAEIIKNKNGWNFEITNQPANQGSDAVKETWAAPHDGYTLIGATENILSLAPLGLANQTAKDWSFFIIFSEPSVLAVAADSPYKTVEDVVKAAKENPGKIRMGNGGLGKSFHLRVKAFEKVAGIEFAHPSFKTPELGKALSNRQADVVSAPITSVSDEAAKGNIRILASTDAESNNFEGGIGKVESLIKFYPEYKKYLPLDGVIAFAMPKGAPKETVDAFGKAFEEAVNSPEAAEYIQKNYGIKINLWGDNAKEYIRKMESDFAWLEYDLGIAKVDPSTLGIPRP